MSEGAVRVIEIENGHCPMVDNAERIAEIIISTAVEFSKHRLSSKQKIEDIENMVIYSS
jgi:hypothetical protein